MYNLTKKEKLDFILEKVKELKFSAYEISKEIKLTEAGVSRILKGIAKNPHETSLDEIILFLESKVLGTETNKVEESKTVYEKENNDSKYENNPLVRCLTEKNKLTHEILKLQNLLRHNEIKFTDYFENESNK